MFDLDRFIADLRACRSERRPYIPGALRAAISARRFRRLLMFLSPAQRRGA